MKHLIFTYLIMPYVLKYNQRLFDKKINDMLHYLNTSDEYAVRYLISDCTLPVDHLMNLLYERGVRSKVVWRSNDRSHIELKIWYRWYRDTKPYTMYEYMNI